MSIELWKQMAEAASPSMVPLCNIGVSLAARFEKRLAELHADNATLVAILQEADVTLRQRAQDEGCGFSQELLMEVFRLGLTEDNTVALDENNPTAPLSRPQYTVPHLVNCKGSAAPFKLVRKDHAEALLRAFGREGFSEDRGLRVWTPELHAEHATDSESAGKGSRRQRPEHGVAA